MAGGADAGMLFDERPLGVELLTNRTTAKERERIAAGLADGTVDIVIGTHALIEEGVQFRSLGVVVVDEQHRFGVEQRAALRAKGADGSVPDVLVMTATPIPRTAAMTVYGDLDVTDHPPVAPGPAARSRPAGSAPGAPTARPACRRSTRCRSGSTCATRWPPGTRPTSSAR